jgi:calcineurin-like phosphoesterase family protein
MRKMNTWITSDLHLFHKNILKYSPKARPFKDIDEMHDYIISNWNNTVKSDDTVYILGDVSLVGSQKVVPVLQQLNGSKILIEGNHDQGNLKSSSFRACFTEVHKYKDFFYKDTRLILFHYPIVSWAGSHHGSIHLFGHCHGRYNPYERGKDVGMCTNKCLVYNLDDVIAELKGTPFNYCRGEQ